MIVEHRVYIPIIKLACPRLGYKSFLVKIRFLSSRYTHLGMNSSPLLIQVQTGHEVFFLFFGEADFGFDDFDGDDLGLFGFAVVVA